MHRKIQFSLVWKLALPIFFVAFLPIAFTTISLKQSLFSDIRKLESAKLLEATSRTANVLKLQQEQLLVTLLDYANWVELNDPKTGRDPVWLQQNIIGWVPSHFGVDVIVLADKNGEAWSSYGMPKEFGTNISRLPIFKAAIAGTDQIGYLETSAGLLMVAIANIVPPPTAEPTVPVASSPGVIMYGMLVDDAIAESIHATVGNHIAVFDRTGRSASSYGRALAGTTPTVVDAYREEMTPKMLYGYMPLVDHGGASVATVRIEQDRMAENLVRARVEKSTVNSALLGLLAVLVLALIISVYLARPLTRLTGFVKKFTLGQKTELRPSGRNDELGVLEESFVRLTTELGVSKRSLSDRERELESANTDLHATKAQLEQKLKELKEANRFMVGRELKMVELKKDIEKLKNGGSKPPKTQG